MAVKIESPFDRARLAVALSVERLRHQVQQAKSQQFPGDHSGPKQWLDLISGLLDTATRYLNDSAKAGMPQSAAENLIRDAAHLASEAYRCLVLMRGAGMDELPYAIIPPLQRWFDQLQVSNSTFFRTELVANYELAKIPDRPFRRVRNPSASLARSIRDIRWPFLRVTVPGRAFSIIPHLAIVAHEIGHALFDSINWDLSSFLSTEGRQLFQRIQIRLGISALSPSDVKFLQRVFKSWGEELSADAFAFYLTGPAIFFSLGEFSQFLSAGYGLSDTHPANYLRRQILFTKLVAKQPNSFGAVFKKHTGIDLTEDFNSPLITATPDSNQLYSELSSVFGLSEAAVLCELNLSLPKLVDMVYDQVGQFLQSRAPDAVYPTRYDTDLTEHLEQMLAAVPPIETGASLVNKAPTEFATIINVGWAVLLTRLSDLRVRSTQPDPFGANRLETLQGLLSKAVELSEARRTWQA